MGIFNFFNRAWDGEAAQNIKRHLQEESEGEVWSFPEMLQIFKVIRQVQSPKEFAETTSHKEFEFWWLAKEPGIGQVEVVRRADGVRGTLYFNDKPRFYFGWQADE